MNEATTDLALGALGSGALRAVFGPWWPPRPMLGAVAIRVGPNRAAIPRIISRQVGSRNMTPSSSAFGGQAKDGFTRRKGLIFGILGAEQGVNRRVLLDLSELSAQVAA